MTTRNEIEETHLVCDCGADIVVCNGIMLCESCGYAACVTLHPEHKEVNGNGQ